MTLPKFPNLTKNEKIVVFSSVIIIILFWGGFLGYYLIKLDRIVNSETKPIDTNSYRLPTSSPTLTPTQQPKQKPTLARFTDSQYGFSFIYPSELTVKEINNPREKLLKFAIENYSTPRPTPFLETTLPIIKQYSVINPNNPETDLIDVSIIEGSYQVQVEHVQDMAKAYQVMPDADIVQVVSYSELNLSSNQKAIVLKLPDGSGGIYTIAYYPFNDKYYLQLEIQPDYYSESSKSINGILSSVRLTR